MLLNRDFEFELFLGRAASRSSLGAYFGLIMLSALALFFIGFGISIPFVPILVVGLIPVGGILLMIYRFKGDLKGDRYWVNLFVNEPEKIVWIKPVNIRHTAAYVITLYNEMHFQVLTSEGLSIMIKCDSQDKQLLFYKGIMQYIPNAHIGFHDQIKSLYSANPATFLQEMQRRNWYVPVRSIATK